MLRKMLLVAIICLLANLARAVTPAENGSHGLTAAEIASRNAAARGGQVAWLKIQTLAESGRLTAGGDQRTPSTPNITGVKRPASAERIPTSPRLKEEAQLPFVMEMERPRKIRFELVFAGKTAVQVYDGVHGWKVRPYLNRLEVEPYTSDELKLASMQSELDGPLMNYEAKGTHIELEGKEKVSDRDTYKLKLTTKEGRVSRVWIDAETFLEAKVEGQPRRLDGKEHPVEIYYLDYRHVNGLQFPFLLETHVLPTQLKGAQPSYPVERIYIDKITINPKLDESKFTKPEVQMAGNVKP